MPPDSATASAAPGAPPVSVPGATEIVHRPDPGLARGAVEGPTWLFYAVTGAALVLSALYLAHRLGRLPSFLRRAPVSLRPGGSLPPPRRTSIPPSSVPPSSRRGSIPPPRSGSSR